MDGITLSAGIRANLNSLQASQFLLARTQERLGTGLKVNSPTDNPTNYFTAQSLGSRASDLRERLDGIAKGISTVKAASTGITAINSLLKQAKSVASDARALSTAATTERDTLMARFNELLVQIDDIAKDSGYDGVNLLKGDSLTVEFAEKAGSSSIDMLGFDAASNGSVVTIATQTSGDWSAGASATDPAALQGYWDYLNGIDSGAYDTYQQAMASAGLDPNSEADRAPFIAWMDTTVYNFWVTNTDPNTQKYSDWYAANSGSLGSGGGGNASIDQAIRDIETSIQNLRTESKTLSANLGVLTARQSFTNDLANVLTSGRDQLVNADMNEEAASLLALNTQQQLGVNALSLASQANGAVLRLLA